MLLDKLSLDEMVQNQYSNHDDWKKLLKDPERVQVWDDAVKRREKLNQFCYFAVKWPQFASYYCKAKRFVKYSSVSPKISLKYEVNLINELALTLSSTKDMEEVLLVDIEWGREQIIVIQGEKIVSFCSESPIKMHYKYEESEGWITSNDKWNFSPNEGAVVFAIIDSDLESSDLNENLNYSKSVSYIVLLPLQK